MYQNRRTFELMAIFDYKNLCLSFLIVAATSCSPDEDSANIEVSINDEEAGESIEPMVTPQIKQPHGDVKQSPISQTTIEAPPKSKPKPSAQPSPTPPPEPELILEPVPDSTTPESQPWQISLSASLLHSEENITFSCSECPEGLSVNASGLVTWTPGFNDAGTYKLLFQANAASLTAEQSMKVIVTNTNRSPEIALTSFPTPYAFGLSSNDINLSFVANDADGPAAVRLYYSPTFLSCQEDNLNSWTAISSSLTTADTSFTWELPQAGILYICGEVDDGEEKHYSLAGGAILALPGDMVQWLKADSGITELGGEVSSWEDQSGNDYHVTQATPGTQPELVDSVAGDLPAIRFDGIDDMLGDAHTFDAQTVFATYMIDSTRQESTDLGGIWGSYADSIHVAIDARTADREFSFDGSGGNQAKYAINSGAFSSLVANGVNVAWEYDTIQLIAAEFETKTSINEVIIGGLASALLPDHRFGGAVGEILIYDRVLDVNEIAAVRLYLSDRWLGAADPTPPPELASLTATPTTDTTVSISWQSGGGSTNSFQITYSEGTNAPPDCTSETVVPSSVIGSASSSGISGLAANTSYAIRVCAVNTASIPPTFSNGLTTNLTTLAEEPKPPLTGLALWLASNFGVTDDGNGRVSAWQDRSINGFVVEQTEEDYRPSIATGAINGADAIRFDGVDDWLEGTDSFTSRTVIALYRVDSSLQGTEELAQIWGQYSGVGHVGPDPRSGSRGFSFDGNTSIQASYALDGAAMTTAAEDSNEQQWTYDAYHLVTVEFTTDLAVTNQCLGSLCGSFAVGEHQFGGDIIEILVYDTTLDAATRTEAEIYLYNKYGL
jgi:hypothetical protein